MRTPGAGSTVANTWKDSDGGRRTDEADEGRRAHRGRGEQGAVLGDRVGRGENARTILRRTGVKVGRWCIVSHSRLAQAGWYVVGIGYTSAHTRRDLLDIDE